MENVNQTLFILCGEAFAGKSTLSKMLSHSHDALIIGRDEIYFATENMLALANTPEEDDEKFWNDLWPVVVQGVKNQLLLGNSVVVDDNCFYLAQRNELRALAKDLGVKSTLIYLDIPAKTLRKRKDDNKITMVRHDVPSAILEKDTKPFERPTDQEKPIIYSSDICLEDFVKGL